MDFINLTTIIFDAQFSVFINTLHAEHPQIIDAQESDDYNDLLKAQQLIRTYVAANSSLINTKGNNSLLGTKQKPNMYAISLAMACPIDECETWQDVFSHFNSAFCCNYDDKVNYFDQIKCACGHDCNAMNSYIIKNIHTHQRVLLGSECILKTGICTKGMYHSLPYLRMAAQKQKVKTEAAEARKLELRKLTNRMCRDCQEFNILKTSPHWKKQCLPCWKKMKNGN